MGTKIEAVSLSRSFPDFLGGNSIKLSARAASQCLISANRDPINLDMLINTGVYRYKNVGEPSIASIIQRKINLKGNYKNDFERPGSTFSFDLNNGGCGLLTGIEIMHGFISTGEISEGIVVTGDSEPFFGLSAGYNFEPVAAAVFLSKSEDTGGFGNFGTFSFPDHIEEFTGYTSYSNSKWYRRGKNILNIQQKNSYLNLCIDCAADSLFRFLDKSGLRAGEIDLFITSQSPAGFVDGIKSRIGGNKKFVEVPKRSNKELHTAGMAFALKKAWEDNRFKTSGNIIFLVAGSGITISVAHYKNLN